MHRNTMILVCSLASLAFVVVSGQQSGALGAFTVAQAGAGRRAYEKTCCRCHTTSVLGRKGAAGELPPVESLSASDQEFIRRYGPVPALAGPAFVARWGGKTVAQTIARFHEGVQAFPPDGRNEQTAVEIVAYALQVSGAKPGDRPLLKSSEVTVGSLID